MNSVRVDENGINSLIRKVELRVGPLRDKEKLIEKEIIFREKHGVYEILTIPLEFSAKEDSDSLEGKFAVVTKNVIDYFKEVSEITEDSLFELAAKNTAAKTLVMPMKDAVAKILDQVGLNPEEIFRGENHLWVITNDLNIYGAAGFLIPEVQKKVSEAIGCDSFYILPSSVHECIVVPETKIMDQSVDELCDMVRCVNSSVVESHDFLSDNVYKYYDGKLWTT